MARNITFYTLLGVAEDVDAKAIKAAYRQWVKKYHPDVCDHLDATEYFKSINKAWKCLGDTEKRRKYDKALRRMREASKVEEESVPPNWSWSPPGETSNTRKQGATPDWSWSPPMDEDVYEGPLMWYKSWRIRTGIAAAMLVFLAGLAVTLSMTGKAGDQTADPVAPSTPPPTPPIVVARKVSDPVFSPKARTLAEPTNIRVSCDTPKANIHYTVNGSVPTRQSERWREDKPIKIEPGTMLRARAFHDGLQPS